MTVKVKRVKTNVSLVQIDLPNELAQKILRIQQCESQFQGRQVSIEETFELILDNVIDCMEAELTGEKTRSPRTKKSVIKEMREVREAREVRDAREVSVAPSRDGKKGVTWH